MAWILLQVIGQDKNPEFRATEIALPLFTSEIEIQESNSMNDEQFKGQWKQLKGKVKTHWGDLTDDDLTTSEGKIEHLIGKIQERYGITREEAKKQLDEFKDSL